MDMDPQGPVTMGDSGQAAPAPEGITPAAPPAIGGQAAAPPSAPAQGQAAFQGDTPPAQVEPTFFDPSSLPPELQDAYKQMQGAFTKKMQAISQERQKIDAYNQFMADPVGNMQQLARQYGMNLTKAEAQQMINQQQDQAWEPQNWNEVLAKAKDAAVQEIMQQFQPFLQTVQKVQASNIESQLAQIDPNWRMYEDDMRSNLAAHPTLVNDVGKLYRLSVPEEVWESKATQKALKKLEAKKAAGQVADKGQTSRSAPVPQKAKTFAEAWELAKQTLADQGR